MDKTIMESVHPVYQLSPGFPLRDAEPVLSTITRNQVDTVRDKEKGVEMVQLAYLVGIYNRIFQAYSAIFRNKKYALIGEYELPLAGC
jgi:hypothetical protein